MKRRDFFKSFSSIALLGTLPLALKAKNQKAEYNWKMVTTWPKNFPGLGTGAQYLADSINKLSGGRIKVTVYGAGELVPAFEIFDAVSNGVAELGHGSAYYWKGKNDTFQFFSTVPFGMKSETWNFLRKLRKIQIHQQIQGSVTERSETDYCWLYCALHMVGLEIFVKCEILRTLKPSALNTAHLKKRRVAYVNI